MWSLNVLMQLTHTPSKVRGTCCLTWRLPGPATGQDASAQATGRCPRWPPGWKSTPIHLDLQHFYLHLGDHADSLRGQKPLQCRWPGETQHCHTIILNHKGIVWVPSIVEVLIAISIHRLWSCGLCSLQVAWTHALSQPGEAGNELWKCSG